MTKRKNTETAVAVADPQVAAIATMTEAGDIAGLKDAAAMASGLQKAAKARGLGITQENKAAEVVLRAERGIGIVLLDLKGAGKFSNEGAANARWAKEKGVEIAEDEFYSLESLGLKPDQSSKFQALARLDEERFEAMLADVKAKAERIAKVDFYRGAQPPAPKTEPQYEEPEEVVMTLLRKANAEVEGGAFERIPADELPELKNLIQTLVSGYAAEKERRAHTG